MFAVEPWCVRERELHLELLTQTESIFALSNGHIGLRGNLDEGEPSGSQWAGLSVRDRMQPLAQALVLDSEAPLGEALRDLARTEVHRALVRDHRPLHPLLSMTDAARVFEVLAGEDIGYLGGTPHGRGCAARRRQREGVLMSGETGSRGDEPLRAPGSGRTNQGGARTGSATAASRRTTRWSAGAKVSGSAFSASSSMTPWKSGGVALAAPPEDPDELARRSRAIGLDLRRVRDSGVLLLVQEGQLRDSLADPRVDSTGPRVALEHAQQAEPAAELPDRTVGDAARPVTDWS